MMMIMILVGACFGVGGFDDYMPMNEDMTWHFLMNIDHPASYPMPHVPKLDYPSNQSRISHIVMMGMVCLADVFQAASG